MSNKTTEVRRRNARYFVAVSTFVGAATIAYFMPRAPANEISKSAQEKGTQVYGHFCSHCHGYGMVNPGISSFDLRQFPKENESYFREILANGSRNMPAVGKLMRPEEIDQVWAYVKSGGK